MNFTQLYEDQSGNAFVATLNYASRIIFSLVLFYFAPGFWGNVIAIAYLIFLHPIIWNLADKFRQFTQPDAFLSNGAMDTFNKKIFWMVGPQFSSTFFVTLALLISFIFLLRSKNADEIANTPPMSLPVEEATEYFIFNVNKEKGFLSNPLLFTASINPVVLTGGVPVALQTYGSPSYEDTADKNTKKLHFPIENRYVYVPESCIEKLLNTNKEIQAKLLKLPGRDCNTSDCTYLVDPRKINLDSYKNNACQNMALLPFDSTECEIRINGEISRPFNPPPNYCKPEDMVFVFSTSGVKGAGLTRSRDLERLRAEKLSNPSAEKEVPTEKQQEETNAAPSNIQSNNSGSTESMPLPPATVATED